jgi:hypothetical protein
VGEDGKDFLYTNQMIGFYDVPVCGISKNLYTLGPSELSNKKTNPYHLRVAATFSGIVDIFLSVLKKWNVNRVAIIAAPSRVSGQVLF